MTAVETALMELAYQVQRYLYENNMTVASLSKRSGVAKESIDKAIREERITVQEMQEICGTLDISLDSLRRLPTSESFTVMQQLVLNKVQSDCSCSCQSAAEEIVDSLECIPPFEQSRNIRWLKQAIEHPEMYEVYPKQQTRKTKPQYRLLKFFSKIPIASGVCFTRKISRKQKQKLEQIIQDSKKK